MPPAVDCFVSLYDLLVVVSIAAAWALVLVLVKNAYRPVQHHYSNDHTTSVYQLPGAAPPRSTYSPPRNNRFLNG